MTSVSTSTTRAYDVRRLREDFPILATKVHGKPLVYLDNAATTQKPRVVIDAHERYYTQINANIHRGIHHLSQAATDAYELARARVQRFINAPSSSEIIFTRGTTEAINLVAASWGGANLKPGDAVLISAMEHHSNIVPWQIICERTGAKLLVIPINDAGELMLDEFDRLLAQGVKIVSINHVSNALGTVNPIAEVIRRARRFGAKVMIDGAQAAAHQVIDVQALGCDFYAFSGHKLYGPTGVGVLWGRLDLLEVMPPYQSGGDMIKSVSFEKTVYNDPPYRFEAGTPNIAGPIVLAAAMDYVQDVGLSAIAAHEHDLLAYGTAKLQAIRGLRLIGTARDKVSVLSFVLDFADPLTAGEILDRDGIAVRTGHHCAEPVMRRFGVPATIRASLALYNTKEEIDALADSIERVRRFF